MNKYLLFLLLIITLISCKQPKVYYQESGSVFNTFYKIKYQSDKLLTEQIDAELQAFNLSLNPFNPNSILARVNRNEEVEVDEWFRMVFTKSQEVSRNSNGFFDPTAAPFINLWGFGFQQQDSVSQHVIDSLKAFVGFQKIRLEGNRVIKDDPRILLNFSAIAKGFACDVIAALLERNGVENYMVDIGGEEVVKGVNPNGQCWRIGINKPEDEESVMKNEVQVIVALCDPLGLATSGNYRNFYIKDGKKYAHTINPLTGYPSESDLLSATVIAADCMTADAYATAFMAMGLDNTLRLVDSLPEIEYYVIYADANGQLQVKLSEGLKQMIVNRRS